MLQRVSAIEKSSKDWTDLTKAGSPLQEAEKELRLEATGRWVTTSSTQPKSSFSLDFPSSALHHMGVHSPGMASAHMRSQDWTLPSEEGVPCPPRPEVWTQWLNAEPHCLQYFSFILS